MSEASSSPDTGRIDEVLKAFGVATTQTEIDQERRYAAIRLVGDFLQNLRLGAAQSQVLERIAIVCTDNMDANCNHRMALDFVRQIANDALTGSVPSTVRAGQLTEQLENANAAASALNGDVHQMGQQLEKYRAALELADKADEIHVNCPECDGEIPAEQCELCFPSADAARLARRDALGRVPQTSTTCQKCGSILGGEAAQVGDEVWCHPCADRVPSKEGASK